MCEMDDHEKANALVRRWYPSLGPIGTARRLAESGLRVAVTPVAVQHRAFRLGVRMDRQARQALNAASAARGHQTRLARAAARAAAPVPPTPAELLRQWLRAPRPALLRAIDQSTRDEVTR